MQGIVVAIILYVRGSHVTRDRIGPSSNKAQGGSKVQVATEPRQVGPIRKGASDAIASEPERVS